MREVLFGASMIALWIVAMLSSCGNNSTDHLNNYMDKKSPYVPPPVCNAITDPYPPQSPADEALDFALFGSGGKTFHVFHINGHNWIDYPRSSRDFGHAISYNNLESWVQQDNIDSLRYQGPNDDGWSSEHIWAPHIVQDGSTIYMFYTGVEYPDGGPSDNSTISGTVAAGHFEAIGLAVSDNLSDWEFYDADGDSTGFLLSPEGVTWTTWGDTTMTWANDCRDPFVMEYGYNWVMLVSIKLSSSNAMAIAYLTAVNLTGPWYWQGPINITGVQSGHSSESACMVEKNGDYYLSWTENCFCGGGHGITRHVATATNPFNNSWTSMSVDNLFGIANEFTVTSLGDIVYSAIDSAKIFHKVFDTVNAELDTLTDCSF